MDDNGDVEDGAALSPVRDWEKDRGVKINLRGEQSF